MARRVLIIEDDWAIARALCTRLGACGFAPRVASDGESGIRIASEFQPEAILLDLRMPDMDGLEVLAILRKDRALAGIPVIVLTANVKDTARQEAKAAGAAAFFAKPFEHRQLVACLERVMAQRTISCDRSDGPQVADNQSLLQATPH